MVLSGSISNKKKHEADRIRVLINEKKKKLEEDEDRKKRHEQAMRDREEQLRAEERMKAQQRNRILGDDDGLKKNKGEEYKKEREDYGAENVL